MRGHALPCLTVSDMRFSILQLSTVDTVSLSAESQTSSPIVSGQTFPLDLSVQATGGAFEVRLRSSSLGLPNLTRLHSTLNSSLSMLSKPDSYFPISP